ncbi:MAG TPA: class I SAM-dependent methyltransferase [Rhodanobacteraceae bacterium]|jgi:SAM-dependent methyltransferase|nr:class I SAM-dependent methyltransferase [Rhodanobacteraceae bacterium]
MSEAFDVQRRVLGPLLTCGLWTWSHYVFRPAAMLKSLGVFHPNALGTPPLPHRFEGGGPDLSTRFHAPVLLEDTPGHYDSVVEFDHCSDDYEMAVKPFSQPVFDELLALLLPHLVPDARILDPSCGPGIEAIALARLVPEGEVVAADLSRGMVETAWRNARDAGVTNMAFVQADVGDPPATFEGYFDAISCCLAFHHYPDGAAAVRAWRKLLRPGGMAFVADPGPKWFNDMSNPWAKLADPGFIQHRTGAEFQALFREAGFKDVYWVEALPGIGITVAGA